MHEHDEKIKALADNIMRFARERTELHPIPLGAPRTADDLLAECGPTITSDGIGGDEAMRLFMFCALSASRVAAAVQHGVRSQTTFSTA